MIYDQLEERFGKKPIIYDQDGESYGFIDFKSFASNLSKFIKDDKLVIILTSNSPGSVLALVSILNLGLVPILLDFKISSKMLEQYIKIYKPHLVFIPKREMNQIFNYEEISSIHGFTVLRNKEKNYYEIHPNIRLLMTTSGSTGSPKLVKLSETNILSNSQAIIKYLNITPDDRAITTLPIHYSYGLSIINSHLIAGAALVVTQKSVVEKIFWKIFKDSKCNSISGVPYTYEILDKINFYKFDLPELKYLTQAGGRLNTDTTIRIGEYCQEKNISFFKMYGQTEATARMTFLDPQLLLSKPDSIGKPIPGGKIELVGLEGNIIESTNKIGEIRYHGENVYIGYAQNIEDLKTQTIKNDYLDTGDLAYRDEDGDLFLKGRKNNFVKIYGYRVSLDQVEKIIGDCACIALKDNIIIFTTNTKEEGIYQKISASTTLPSKIFKIIHIEEFPRLSNFKIDRKKLEIIATEHSFDR
jgi:long-chain acyl-CoA synthetase